MELLEREAEDENKIQIQLFCRFKIKKNKKKLNEILRQKKKKNQVMYFLGLNSENRNETFKRS